MAEIVEAVPFGTARRSPPRDGDLIYGERVQRRIQPSGIDEVITAEEWGLALTLMPYAAVTIRE